MTNTELLATGTYEQLMERQQELLDYARRLEADGRAALNGKLDEAFMCRDLAHAMRRRANALAMAEAETNASDGS